MARWYWWNNAWWSWWDNMWWSWNEINETWEPEQPAARTQDDEDHEITQAMKRLRVN